MTDVHLIPPTYRAVYARTAGIVAPARDGLNVMHALTEAAEALNMSDDLDSLAAHLAIAAGIDDQPHNEHFIEDPAEYVRAWSENRSAHVIASTLTLLSADTAR